MIRVLNQVIHTVKEAAQLLRDRNLSIDQKGNDSNYVTSTDLAVERYLDEKLCALLPGSKVLGEENNFVDYGCEYLWVVDPIDGTSNFIRDLGLSAISVGLLKGGQPYMGVIYHPYRDEIYYAQKGKGAFLNGRPIHVSDRGFTHSHLCSAMSLYDKSLAAPCFKVIEEVYYQSDDLRRSGSAALELAWLAAGRVELYFEIRLFPWDVAAAMTIISEAGGFAEYMFHKDMPLTEPFGLIAANSAENFEKLKSIVHKHIPEKLY